MKKFIKKAVFTACILFYSAQAFGQFSGDALKFLKELESYLSKDMDRKEVKNFVESFTPVWNSISQDNKEVIFKYSNILIAKGAHPYPEYYDYIHGIHGFFTNKHPQSAFNEFHEVIDKIFVGADKKKYGAYLKATDGFFNTGVVYQNANIKWRVTSRDYKIYYEKTPVFEFNKANLCVISIKNDSSLIAGTSGVYRPLLDTWQGKGGKVNWARAGLDSATTYAELNKYKLNMKTAGFDADSCLMHTTYFQEPLEGRVSDKLVNISKAIGVTFPKFQSYSQRLFIKDIFKDVDYEGGFSLEGASLFGTGSADESATLIFYKDGKRFINCYSRNFIIKPDKVNAERTRVVINIEKDSITHPGIVFKYDVANQTVFMMREGAGTAQAPFFNSYHMMDMKFDMLSWKQGSQDLNMGPGVSQTAKSNATFESYNYFSMARYQKMLGMDVMHPATAIERLYLKKDTLDLNIYDVCSALGGTKDMVLPTIFMLAEYGLLDVDTENDLVHLKKKMFNYSRAATKEKDFDVIFFDSETNGDNASINCLSYDLIIKGLKRVTLSDTQFVKIYPKDGTISIKKNRNLIFDGIINAGNTEYFGRNFSFEYDEFKLNVVDCDSMRIRVAPLDVSGPQKRLISVINGVKGVIYIDDKENKAGIKRGFENYPIFECNAESYVYYNKVYRGVYDSTQFYFKIDKFKLDSLDNFKNTALRFNGEFKSAGIFPIFKESLKVMPDYSLGFIRKAPEAGAKIYADKGLFKNTIRLSGKGLQGDGTISFLTSTADSDAFTFFPDSTNGVATKYVNKQTTVGMNVPKIEAEGCFVKYAPKEKVFTAKSLDKPLLVYNPEEKVQMKGIVTLKESGMTGRGKIYFSSAELSAKKFIFRSRTIDSDTANFQLKNMDENQIFLKSKNVKAHIDFDKRYGEFARNDGNEPMVLEDIQYVCFMDRFKWYMDNEDLQFEADRKNISIDSDIDLTQSNFFSIHPDQDSLNFMAPKAIYDMKRSKLTCDKVTYMDIADARIVPDSQRVIVRRHAEMDEFKNAKIIANSVTKYHNIFNAKVKVTARKKYTASGDYLYVDEDKKESNFHFAKITVDTTFTSYADGEITEEMKFMLSSNFAYKGKITLRASDIGLNFDGYTQINTKCKNFTTDWFRFKGVVDANNIEIPIEDEVLNPAKNPLMLGPVLDIDSVSLYTTFFTEKSDKKDPVLITAKGILIYDHDSKQYMVGTREKFAETTLPGSMITLNKEKCIMTGDGKIDLGMDMDLFEALPAGVLTRDVNTTKTEMNVAMQLKFPFIESALEKMAKKINDYPDPVPLESSGSNMVQGLRELAGLDNANKIMEDLLYKGRIKDFPDEIKKSIVLTDLKFVWKSFITEKGEEQGWEANGKAGIINIYGDQVLKVINVRIRILKRRTGDQIQVAFFLDKAAPESGYYYFKYVNGLLSVYSSDTQFMNEINETKDDKKQFKGGKGVKDMTVTTLSSGGTAIGFMTED